MLTIRLTERDILAAYLAHLPAYRFAPAAAAGFALLAAPAMLLPDGWDLLCAACLMLIAASVLAMRYVYLPHKARRIYARRTAFQHPLTLSWNEGGLTVAGPTGSTATPWEEFLK